MNLAKIGNIETEVKVSTLIEALTKFKTEHVADYAVALDGYNKAFEEKKKEYVKKLKNATSTDKVLIYVPQNLGLTKPINNSAMYDQFINAFAAVSTETLTLDINELDTIVNNSWDWVGTANNSMSFYNAKFSQ